MRILIVSINTCKEVVIYPEGPLYIAKYLEDHADIQIYPVTNDLDAADLPCTLENYAPDLVFLSIRDLRDLSDISRDVAHLVTAAGWRVLIGGAAPSVFPQETTHILQVRRQDVVPGEFEATFSRSLVRQSCPVDLDDLPMPDWTAISKITSLGRRFRPKQKGVEWKRGCVHQCVYCSYPYLGGQHLRMRSVDTVVKNVAHLYEHGIEEFFFTDSILNVPKSADVLLMLRSLSNSGISARYGAFVHPKFTSEEVDLYRKLNCNRSGGLPDPPSLHG